MASAGAKVVFSGSVEQAPDRTGEQRTVKRSVRVIDPLGSRRPAPDAVQKYRAAGRSVYAEALAAGYSPAAARRMTQQGGATLDAEPPIYASGCVYSEEVQPDPEFEWSGCYKLYDVQAQDADAWYVAGSGTARGWGTNALSGGKELNAGYSEIFWNAFEGEIIEAAPSANRDGDNCRQFTISLARIIELSYQVPLCDDRWAVTWDQWHHRVQWEGASIGGSSDLRSASGASTLRVPSYVDTIGMEYQVGWAYRCFC
ncbi:hypothetical protein [Plantactinospora sp. KLBMP9567]|uniref:hypothetical protein n=1 Tax=Plantactinospora sp. KLBMP9567 TaxID=3085900 RepID=UPI00298101C3|nr:hypothetical protein [Plantactinospora sp. KLBMP9567]MDW5328551.1 hypothetical protein [Plantactinospora sp. KLBMP9567]